MMRTLFLAVAILGLTVSMSAHAQDEPVPLACEYLTIPISNVPDATAFTFTIPPDNLINQCTAENDNPIRLVTPQNGIAVSVLPKTSQTFRFTVQDDYGHQATAQVTVTRD